VAQIRKGAQFNDSKEFRIFLYLLLPEDVPNSNWAGQNYWANGYASLTELNALSVKRYCPYDISMSGTGGRIAFGEKDSDNRDPFNGAYLFTNQNKDGFVIDVDKDVPDLVATFLYHKIYSANVVGEAQWQLKKAENFELKSQGKTPETGPVPEPMGTEKKSEGEPERSRRFLSFGIKQIAYPEEEIRDYLTHAFARQAALQLAYNHWEDEKGFIEVPRNISVSEYVRQPENLVKWKLSDDHLSLSTGILSVEVDNKDWKPIENDWTTILATFTSDIKEHKKEDRTAWLDELTKLCSKRFREGFRKMGVVNFYEGKVRDRADHVREIVRAIEQDLLNQWITNGKYGCLFDISRLLEGLIKFVEEKHGLLLARQDKLSKEMAVLEARKKQQQAEWDKIGLFTEITGKRERIFDARALAEQSYYAAYTHKEALRFSLSLLKDLGQELQVLRGNVDRALTLINKSAKYFLEQKESRCQDEKEIDLNKQLVRFYDPQHVKDVCRVMEKDKESQKAQTARLRAGLQRILGQNPTFAKITLQISESKIREMMEGVCKESVEDSHTKAIQEMKNREPLFGVNIVEKIEKRFGSDDIALRQFVSDVVGKASVFLKPDAAEKAKHGPLPNMVPDHDTWIEEFTIILPQTPGEFGKKLESEFKRMAKSSDPSKMFAYRSDRPHEIVIINLTMNIPLRTVAPMNHLKKKYEDLLNTKGERAMLELHTEDWSSGKYPGIYMPSLEELSNRSVPYLLLALALGILKESEDKKNRILQSVIKKKGLDDVTVLKSDIIKTADEMDAAHLQLVEQEVKGVLASKASQRSEIQGILLQMAQREQEVIKTKYGASSKENSRLVAGNEAAQEILSA
jgi:polyhydroxyalkanoate synthesis regulator protein